MIKWMHNDILNQKQQLVHFVFLSCYMPFDFINQILYEIQFWYMSKVGGGLSTTWSSLWLNYPCVEKHCLNVYVLLLFAFLC